jgi:LAS superfamily LD-carboxypeptidase LdcB
MPRSFLGKKYKRILPVAVFVLLLIPIITSSLLDLKEKKTQEMRLEQERIQREAYEAEEGIYLMGKFNPVERTDFVLIPAKYVAAGASQSKMYLRKETSEAFLEMQSAADEDDIDLKIASATRNFDYQKELWNKKWNNFSGFDEEDRFEKILEYSAVPGTSRHHWGTDIDINDATPEYFDTERGEEVYEWLVANAPMFGFCQTYSKKDESRKTGYHEEKWHWSYLPISRELTEEYKNLIGDEDIKGFLGDEYAGNFNLINDYVLSINPDCI